MIFRRPLFASNRLAIALALILGAGLAPSPSGAAPSLREVVRFTGSTFNRLCNDAHASRFARIDTTVKTRICHAAISAGRLILEVRYRREAADSAGFDREASGVVRQDVAFNARSHFYCSSPRTDGFATLYMNCLGNLSRSGKRCAKYERQLFSDERGIEEESYRRSFANVIETGPENCAMLKRALNFIASRSREYSPDAVRDFFSND